MTSSQLYTVAEVCKIARICRALLYKEWKAGRGPKRTKIGRRTFTTADALEEWLRSCEQITSPGAIGVRDSEVSLASYDLPKRAARPSE